MRMLTWTMLALAVGLSAAGCQGEPTDPTAPSDTAERGVTPEAPGVPCGPQSFGSPFDWPNGKFIEWTPDGSNIVFDDGTRVMVVDVKGTRVETVVDANPGYKFDFGIHADLSSDGSRVVYSSCEYPTGEVDMSMADQLSERGKYHYEIATVALDGSDPKRLTENDHIDHYAVWSPDMTHIAFLSGGYNGYRSVSLRVMRADGSNRRVAVSGLRRVVTGQAYSGPPQIYIRVPSLPPIWSPDGEHLAFFGYDVRKEPCFEWSCRFAWRLYTVRMDGSGVKRISEHTGAAAWSPDGRRIAVARVEGEDVVLETIAPDGSDPRRIIKITDRETSFTDRDFPDRHVLGRFGAFLDPVSWSPDGTHILYVCEAGVCVVDLDGNLIGQSPAELILEESRPHAAWSPDGTRIAVRAPGLAANYSGSGTHAEGSAAVFTMAHDGTDVQVLVRGGQPLVAENAR